MRVGGWSGARSYRAQRLGCGAQAQSGRLQGLGGQLRRVPRFGVEVHDVAISLTGE